MEPEPKGWAQPRTRPHPDAAFLLNVRNSIGNRMFYVSGSRSDHPSRTFALVLFLLVATTYAAYYPGLGGPFLLDDPNNILPVAVEALTIDEIREKIFVGRFGGYSRSLTKLTFTLTQYFSGYDPWAFKAPNLLLHLLNGLLLIALTRQILVTSPIPQSTIAYKWIALTVGGIWLLHPLQVSTVLYAVQRLVLLSAFFSILTAICYIAGRRMLNTGRRAGVAVILLGLLFFWPLGILSKENALLLAPVLLALEWFLFRFHVSEGVGRTFVMTVVSILLFTPLLMLLLLVFTSPYFITSGFIGRDFSLTERLLTETHALVFYLKLIFLPIVNNMGLYHDGFPVQRSLDLATFAAALFLSAFLCLGFLLRRSLPIVGFGIIWFFGWHLMESSAIPLELVFEHRNYLALYGLVLAATVGAFRFCAKRSWAQYWVYIFVALLSGLSLTTHARASTWANVKSFHEAEYRRDKNSTRAVENMFYYTRQWGEPEAAAQYLKELQIVAGDQSWPFVLDIIYRCHEEQVNQDLLDTALRLAATAIIRPSDVQTLRLLFEAVNSGECPSLDPAFPQRLAEQLVNNDRVHVLTTRLALLKRLAEIAAANGDILTSETSLHEAVELAKGMPPARLSGVLLLAETLAAAMETEIEAQGFLSRVIEEPVEHIKSRTIEPSQSH